MPDRSSEQLRTRIAEALPDRPFTVRFWDGGVVEATREGPTLTLRSPRALGHILRAPGELGVGRAYVTGEIEVDDLDSALRLIGKWHPPKLSFATKARLGLAARRLAGGARPEPPAAELQPTRSTHTKDRDAEAVRHHYDLSNEFFALFLDESMTYSCALWEDGVETLEDAQRAKLELICAKLELQPDQRMLDIGCGWGSLGLHAAREYNVRVLGITLSPLRPSSRTSAPANRGCRTSRSSGWPTTATSATTSSTRSPRSGWSSTSACPRATSTRGRSPAS